MEDNKYANLLNEENYVQIKNWLDNPDIQEPEFAESFMTTIYLKYINRKGSTERSIRRRMVKIDTFPSLKKLISNVENKIAVASPSEPAAELPKTSQVNTEQDMPKKEETQETLFEQPDQEITKQELKVSVIGKAIRHCARLHDVKITESHIQIILYVLYGYRLAQGSEDIFKESPQMWMYGPVFPSAYGSLRKPIDIEKEYEDWKAVNKYDIKLGEHIINLVAGLGERKVTELTKKHTAPGTPWHQCRVMNPDKWGTTIDENTIKDYFIKNLPKK